MFLACVTAAAAATRPRSLEFAVDAQRNSIKVGEGGPVPCLSCVAYGERYMSDLLEVIAGGGIIQSCSELCSTTGTPFDEALCELLCTVVGIEAFVRILESADLDPVWLCQEAGACPTSTCLNSTCATPTHSTIAPAVAPGGTIVAASTAVQVNLTGVGVASVQFNFSLSPPAHSSAETFSSGVMIVTDQLATVGVHTLGVSVNTSYVQYGSGATVPWPRGVYRVVVTLCEGLCGSPHGLAIASDTTAVTIR